MLRERPHIAQNRGQWGGGEHIYIYVYSQYRNATQKREAFNLEGVLSLYIESLQKGYKEERGLQSGGSALYIWNQYSKATRKREPSNLEGVLSLYLEPLHKCYTEGRGLQSGGNALFIFRNNTEILHRRARPPIWREYSL